MDVGIICCSAPAPYLERLNLPLFISHSYEHVTHILLSPCSVRDQEELLFFTPQAAKAEAGSDSAKQSDGEPPQ